MINFLAELKTFRKNFIHSLPAFLLYKLIKINCTYAFKLDFSFIWTSFFA